MKIKKKNLNPQTNSTIELQKKIIDKQKEYITLLKKENDDLKELNSFYEITSRDYKNKFEIELLTKYKDIDLMLEAFLIQAKRLIDKRMNKKLKRYTDFQALLLANDKLKKYKLEELVLSVPINRNKPIPANENFTLMQQNYSRTYKKRFISESGKYLQIILALRDSTMLSFILPD